MANSINNQHKDLFEDLFKNNDPKNDPKLVELLDFIENMGNTISPNKGAHRKYDAKKKRVRRKIRNSSYLSPDNHEALNKTKEECQQLLVKRKGRNISKSRIVDISLEIILSDFMANREQSILISKLRTHYDNFAHKKK